MIEQPVQGKSAGGLVAISNLPFASIAPVAEASSHAQPGRRIRQINFGAVKFGNNSNQAQAQAIARRGPAPLEARGCSFEVRPRSITWVSMRS
jgi:hypothetical protein